MQKITLTPQQILAISGTLKRIVTDDGVKLAWGRLKRRELKDQLENGVKVDGYRVEWLRETKNKIVDVLIDATVAFNMRYRHDKISLADLVDVLATTQYHYEVAASQMLKETDRDD